VLAASHPDAAGRLFNVSDGESHTLNEINHAICTALGRKLPRIRIPIRPARLAAGVLASVARLLGRRSPITRSTVDKYTENIVVDGSKIREELGFVSEYSLVAGWEDAIGEMRAMGKLQ
jgi:UDP-glucose 4-epimerase